MHETNVSELLPAQELIIWSSFFLVFTTKHIFYFILHFLVGKGRQACVSHIQILFGFASVFCFCQIVNKITTNTGTTILSTTTWPDDDVSNDVDRAKR